MATYKIIRFSRTKKQRVIKRGLTLKQAQKHCQRKDTRGKTWFDGYTKE